MIECSKKPGVRVIVSMSLSSRNGNRSMQPEQATDNEHQVNCVPNGLCAPEPEEGFPEEGGIIGDNFPLKVTDSQPMIWRLLN
jgi:hypothetical protein